MNPLAAQLAVALCQNPANPVRNEQDALDLARFALLMSRELESEGAVDTAEAVTLRAPARRAENALSVAELADELGISTTGAKRLMSAYEEATGATLERLSNRTRVLPAELLGAAHTAYMLSGGGVTRTEAWRRALGL